ncbi:MAG: beta-N-acetylhexosaminidase [Ginsengibacter sp.]
MIILKKIVQLFQLIIIYTFLLLFSNKIIAAAKPLIFPIPQQMQFTQGNFVLDESVLVILPQKANEKDVSLAHFLINELSDKYGLALKMERRPDIPKDRKVVVMGTIDNPLIKKYCSDNSLTLTKKNPGTEGYILEVSDHIIFVGGSDDAGAFYGLQSLRQLIQSKDGNNVNGVKVRDWSQLPFSAIRMYIPGPENIAFLKRFMKDFMALYKYNKIIIELNCLRLNRHPEVNTGWEDFVKDMQYTRSSVAEGIHGEAENATHYDTGDGFIIEKDAVRDLVKFAHENFLEVIPEMPSYTHSYYLLANHHQLAEDPQEKWPDTYCPSNPKTYDLLFEVYDEYLEVLKPKMVQIGHDEWWSPLNVCPRCRNKDYSELFAKDVNKLHDYFSKRGIKIGMWGDYLLESVRGRGQQEMTSSTGYKYKIPGGLRPSVVKNAIPKDILIFNWFWGDEKKENELNNFGFKQVFGNFTSNITNWDERIKRIDIAGGAPSSWASTNEFNFGKDMLLDFLGCANLLWSPHTIKPEDLPPIVWELVPSIRANLHGAKIPSEDGDSVETVGISSQFNLSKNSKAFNINLSTLKSGTIQNGKKIFQLMNSLNCAIAVGTKGEQESIFPNVVKNIPIHEDVSSLIFLQSCALPANNQKAYFNIPNNFDSPDLLGWYEIIYEDGFREIVPIQYGVNILEWNAGEDKNLDKREGDTGAPQNAYCYEADAVDCSSNSKNPITFFSFEWVNKRFGKAIKEVNLHASENYQALQQNYIKVATAPMPNNAILLVAVSKVKKRIPVQPQ